MTAFLKDITPFYGTHENNEDGQDLESFLEEYDAQKYENPSLTVDTLVFQHKKNFSTTENGLKLLLIKRKNHPSIGYWALPGGFVNLREDVETAAKRELEEETGLTGIAVEQVYTWGEARRDPRARIVTVAHIALIEEHLEVKAGDDAADALWFDVAYQKQKEEITDDGTRLASEYQIILSNAERGINMEAAVAVSENRTGILKEKEYRVLSSENIAFDHSRCIIQALLYIEEQLDKLKHK